MPDIREDEVLVEVRATGICGSDLHVLAGTSPEPMTPSPVLGHETMGVVAQAGAAVTHVRVGQRVGIEPLVGCTRCSLCRTGRYHLCQELELIGMERAGGLAEFVVAPADKVFPLPDSVSDEEAVLLDCVAVAVHVLHRCGVRPASSVAVLGAGTMGNIIAQLAKSWGAKSVVITDTREFRLAIARQVGIDHTFNVTRPDALERLLSDVGHVDYVIEAVGGRAPTINQALEIVALGGRICFMGIFSAEVPVNLWTALRKEASLVPAWSYAHWRGKREFEIAIDLLAEGQVKVSPLITHHFGLSQIERAVQTAQDDERALKVIVTPDAPSGAD